MAASTLAPAKVGEDGKELVNPHIPQFMAKAPWYLHQGDDKGLAHQRRGEVEDQSISSMAKYYTHRGQKVGVASTFRPGSCKNCGSATHTVKACTERPRKVGAWKTGANIAADEAAPESLRLGWDAKRDKYAGYDIGEHSRVVAKFEAIDSERAKLKEEEEEAAAAAEVERKTARAKRRAERAASAEAREARRAAKAAAQAEGAEDESTADEAGAFSSTDDGKDSDFSSDSGGEGGGAAKRVKGGAGAAAKMVAWNVRTREDTAKYLLNLDTESAFYDPKTRSMRENPFAEDDGRAAAIGYAGDNLLRGSGAGPSAMASDQLFAWEAYNRGADVHLQGNPTQVALLKSQFAARKEAVKALVAHKLADRYGGGSGAAADAEQELPAELRLSGAEAEQYREYTAALAPDGRVVAVEHTPGEASTSGPVRSLYAEDVHPGNHTSIFGSWFDAATKAWGFACCQQTISGAYCTGQAGKTARADAVEFAARAAEVHTTATAARSAVAAKRAHEAKAEAAVNAVEAEERARKRARPGDPTAASV
jgi:pre-mRNA-processing factor SLU7